MLSGLRVRELEKSWGLPGRLIGVRRWQATGIYVPTQGMTSIIAKAQGGGGGGGGAGIAAAGNVSLGAPGCNGAYGEGYFTAAQVGASLLITIGAAGAAGSNLAGGNGGTTSIGSLLTAPGGPGGGQFNNQTPPSSNGNGSTSANPSGANILALIGLPGGPSFALSVATAAMFAGQGGGGYFGPGVPGPNGNLNGASAVNYGGGGSGSAVNQGGGSASGGAGLFGLAIILEFA